MREAHGMDLSAAKEGHAAEERRGHAAEEGHAAEIVGLRGGAFA